MLEKLIIINAPLVFKGVWSIVKYWIDKKTRSKIEIHWSNPKDALRKYIDEDKIPKVYGGSCTDEILLNKGPWEHIYKKCLEEQLYYLEEKAWDQYFLTPKERELKNQKNNVMKEEVKEFPKFNENDFLTESEL